MRHTCTLFPWIVAMLLLGACDPSGVDVAAQRAIVIELIWKRVEGTWLVSALSVTDDVAAPVPMSVDVTRGPARR